MEYFNLKKKEIRKKLFYKKNNILSNFGEELIKSKLKLIKHKPMNIIQLGERLNINLLNQKINLYKSIDELFKNQKEFDAILSNFDMQLYLVSNDNIIGQIYKSLHNNGLLCFNLITENSFITLRKFFYEIDESVFLGSYRRFGPFHSIQNIIANLKNNNFKETVVSTEKLELNYNSLEKMRADFREFGISNYYPDKIKFKKKFYLKSKEIFDLLISKNSYFPIEIEIATFTSWK